MIRVLVVDNDNDILSMVRLHLERDNISVTTALSVKEAIRHLEDMNYDVLITDIELPQTQISGIKLLEESVRIQPNIGRIVLTGFDKDYGFTLETKGIYRLQKPCNPKDLVVLVHRLSETHYKQQIPVRVDTIETLKQLATGSNKDFASGVITYNNAIVGIILHRSPEKLIIDWTILKDIIFESQVHLSANELLNLTSGHISIHIDNRVIELSAPSVYIIEKQKEHSICASRGTRFTIIIAPYRGYETPKISLGGGGCINPTRK